MATHNRKPSERVRVNPKHLGAALIAGIATALAFGFPVDPTSLLGGVADSGPDYIEVQLPLPVPEDDLDAHSASPPSPTREPIWQATEVQPGDTMAHIFTRLGLKPDDLYSLLDDCEEAKTLEKVIPGEMLKVRTDGAGSLVELVHNQDKLSGLRILREGDIFRATRFQHEIEKRGAFAAGSVRDSLYGAALRAGLSERVIAQFGTIFGWKIDFSHDVAPGDTFAVVYEEDYFSGEKIGDGEVLAAEFINRGEVYRAIGVRDGRGQLQYYTPEGKTLKQAFMRNPVDFTRISSHFQPSRWHPILGRKRPHQGVDYAAPTGTPVRAAGDGRVVEVGYKGGYGKAIVIDHGRGYTTLYGHLSRFKPGLRDGSAVAQGEVIGYVGQTGFATGPHLHYEFRIDGEHKNPITVALPGGDLDPRYQERFARQVALLTAQLDLYQRSLVAANGE